MKFLIIALLLFVAYLMIKSHIKKKLGLGDRDAGRPKPPITDELVKDPVCGVYLPRMEALVYGKGGKLYYFCSKECLDRFRKGDKSHNPDCCRSKGE